MDETKSRGPATGEAPKRRYESPQVESRPVLLAELRATGGDDGAARFRNPRK